MQKKKTIRKYSEELNPFYDLLEKLILKIFFIDITFFSGLKKKYYSTYQMPVASCSELKARLLYEIRLQYYTIHSVKIMTLLIMTFTIFI